ncbi:unnamed protein product, partial [Rotaria sp. Silwood1]
MATCSEIDDISQPRRKLALVIGIDDYKSGSKLKNTINDANDMSSELKRIGFTTGGPKLNLTCEQMKITIADFERSIEEGDMVLFYFAGHGVQWE